MTPAPAPILLNYTQAQRRWDRNIFYLLSLVCISQAFQVPAPVLQWLERFTYPVFIFWSSESWWTTSRRYSEFAQLVGSTIGLPLTALLVSLAAFLMLFQVRYTRITLIVLASVQIALLTWILAAVSFETYAPEGWTFYTPYSSEELHEHGLGAWFRYFVCIVYPLVLLFAVMRPASRATDPKTPRPRAAWIWRITATACALFAVPTLFNWCTDATMRWVWMTRAIFGVYFGEGWENSLRGIGELSETFACFSMIPLLIYARLKGPAGRHALLICAALLVVAAIAPLWSLVAYLSDFHVGSGLSVGSLHVFEYPVYLFSKVILALTFPLSLRIALSLADLREILDARSAPTVDSEAAPAAEAPALTSPPYPQSPTPQTPAQSTHSPS